MTTHVHSVVFGVIFLIRKLPLITKISQQFKPGNITIGLVYLRKILSSFKNTPEYQYILAGKILFTSPL